MRIISLSTIAIMLTACATTQLYDGDKLARSKVAVIKGGSELNIMKSANVIIKEVDGSTIDTSSNKVEVLPGEHILTLKCQMFSPYSSNTHLLSIAVEAGKTYVLGLKLHYRGDCEGVLVEK